jgi:hypothetical protein
MRRNLITVVLAASFVFGTSPSLLAASSKPLETFKAFAVALGTGKSSIVRFAVERWSTDEEREMLLETLQEFGRDKLVETLQKIRPPVGYILTPFSLRYDLYYARNHQAPDGSRRVVLATNRRVTFREVARSERSMDYQITLIELRLGPDGKGDGKMVPAAKVTWDNATKTIEIENYNVLPVDLLSVTVEK